MKRLILLGSLLLPGCKPAEVKKITVTDAQFSPGYFANPECWHGIGKTENGDDVSFYSRAMIAKDMNIDVVQDDIYGWRKK